MVKKNSKYKQQVKVLPTPIPGPEIFLINSFFSVLLEISMYIHTAQI